MTPRVFWAAAVAVIAVALGLLLGLVPGGHAGVVGPLRTFALAAALTVVVTHLLPEAFGELGATAVLLLALVAAGPAWVRLLLGLSGARESHGTGHAGLAAGYLGLLVHHVGDGIGLGAYARLPGGPGANLDVMLALAVHTVPLVAVFAFAFRAVSGTRAAVTRSAGLALASVGGVLLSSLVSEEVTHAITAWMAAFVAGLLVHVMSHDLDRDLPVTAVSRTIDFAAGLAGAGLCLLGSDAELAEARSALAAVLASDALRVAVALLVAYGAAFLVSRFAGPALRTWLAALPTPAFGLDGVLVGAVLVGPAFGGLLLVGFVLAARLGAGREAPRREPLPAPAALLEGAVPWVVTGLVFGALVRAALPEGAFEALSRPAALGLAVLAALPIWLPPVAAVMVAVALWERGLAPEASLAFALLAVAPRPAEVLELARRVGTGAAVSRLVTGLLVAVGVGSVNAFVERAPLALGGALGALALFVLALGCAAVAWKRGLRALFGAVFHSHDTASPLSTR